MIFLLSLKQGSLLVSLARSSISSSFQNSSAKIPPEKFLSEKLGVFVTLHSFPSLELRGCIGFPLPSFALGIAVSKAALSAAFEDPRFPPLEESELSSISFEVSVLSVPAKFACPSSELPSKIIVGKHGLIVSKGFNSGLLLPQVAPEWNWNSLQFLEQCCLKAGLPKSAWKDSACTVQHFEAQVFREEKPEGKVVEEKLA